MISISIDSRELSRFFRDIKKFEESKQVAIKKEVSRATFSIQKKAKENAPVKKSFLRNHIDAKILRNKLTGEIIVKVKYGIFVHEKTKEHFITPKNAKVLSWLPIVGMTIKGKSNLYIKSEKYAVFSVKTKKKLNSSTFTTKKNMAKWVYTMRVKHPGTKGNPFLRKAVESERPIYTSNLIKIFK